jgi:hypothetical protein
MFTLHSTITFRVFIYEYAVSDYMRFSYVPVLFLQMGFWLLCQHINNKELINMKLIELVLKLHM